MRATVLLALVAVASCASAKTEVAASPQPNAQGILPGSDPRVASTVNASVVSSIPAPMGRVWRVIPAAYDSLGIKLGIYDTTFHLIGNQGLKLRQKLGNVALSKYIDCGHAQIGESADSYDVVLSVVSHVRLDASGIPEIATKVVAAARPMTVSQGYTHCSSKGEIERRIQQVVEAWLSRG